MSAVIIVFLIVLGLPAAGCVALVYVMRKGRAKFRAVANRLGIRYTAQLPKDERGKYPPGAQTRLVHLSRGERTDAGNIFEGKIRGYPIRVFDYQYVIDESACHLSTYIAQTEAACPHIEIYPNNYRVLFGLKASAGAVRGEGPFFDRFVVRCADADVAIALCNARLQRFLAQHLDLKIEINGGLVSIYFLEWLETDVIEERVDCLMSVLEALA